MALTWGAVLVGFFVVFVFPVLIILLNRRRANAGWWLLGGTSAFLVVGNLLEKFWFAPSSLG
ncbi:hypothetical protein [Sphingomonas sp. Root241]|uniref:hypothetical protein n=1 Tax=Sphingomonas sp. Root241 TaxID=1736501 RepID=UPI0007013CDA|nr:hypothetical protein [Sphingomonas sp. Root241]KRC82595.1 hypothetical protein ASE13_10100 [Sphingomonas sp. Root241]